MAPDLGPLGLNADESSLYLFLIDRPPVTPAELAGVRLPTGEASVSDVIRSLQSKGLVTSLTGPPLRHTAIAPDVALDILARVREEEIAGARAQTPDLMDRWRRAGRATFPGDLVEIVVGREATLQRSEQIQRAAAKEVRIIDAPPYASLSAEGNTLEAHLLSRGTVGYRCLYDRSGLEIPGKVASVLDIIAHGEEARVASDLPLKMVMGDTSVAMLPLESAPSSITAAVVIHPSALLNSLRLLFDTLWEKALPLRGAADANADAGDGTGTDLTGLELQVVQLLVTGLTDQAIGRQLGLAERTVQRRVQGIMRTHGVDNRLQLGIRLAESGWGNG